MGEIRSNGGWRGSDWPRAVLGVAEKAPGSGQALFDPVQEKLYCQHNQYHTH